MLRNALFFREAVSHNSGVRRVFNVSSKFDCGRRRTNQWLPSMCNRLMNKAQQEFEHSNRFCFRLLSTVASTAIRFNAYHRQKNQANYSTTKSKVTTRWNCAHQRRANRKTENIKNQTKCDQNDLTPRTELNHGIVNNWQNSREKDSHKTHCVCFCFRFVACWMRNETAQVKCGALRTHIHICFAFDNNCFCSIFETQSSLLWHDARSLWIVHTFRCRVFRISCFVRKKRFEWNTTNSFHSLFRFNCIYFCVLFDCVDN